MKLFATSQPQHEIAGGLLAAAGWRELNSKLKSLCQFKGEGEMSRMELTGIDSSINDDNKLPELP